VDGINMPFEAVTSTIIGQDYVYEPSPRPSGRFNVLFRNDQLGFSSANTGYFFLFKQGTLQNQDFNLADRVSNRTVDINIEGVNNTDVWLYQLDNVGSIATEWTYVPSVYGAAAEQTSPGSRPLSVRIWKPLQAPMTGRPSLAKRMVSCMIADREAIAPQRR
jgi:hypothetical protein